MATYYLDKDGLTYLWGKIKGTFVAKEQGKGLSTNDYTTAEKTKLGDIEAGAEVNVIETVKVNGTAQTVTSKAVDITVPTKLSDLTNDDDFVTDADYVHTDNDYTDSEKLKLGGIEAGAEVNKIDSISVDGTPVTPDVNKNVGLAISGTSETLTIFSWSALSASDPYDYQATVSVTTTISANGTVELVNDQAVLFATYGFAIGAVDTTNNAVTIYSIGEPTSPVSLNIKVRS